MTPSLARQLRPLAALAAAAVLLSGCSDDPSSPGPLEMARRFEELSREHGGNQRAPVFTWTLAAIALRSGAEVGSIALELDGQPRTFQAVALHAGTTWAGVDRRGPTYVVGWGDREGREMLHLWAMHDSVELTLVVPGGPSGPVFTPPVGGASLSTLGKDSVWLHQSGWAKLAPKPAAGECRSSLRPTDVCRVVGVNVGASLVMRQVRSLDAAPPWPTHQLTLRASRVPGVAILQPCETDACSVDFP